MLLHSLPLPLGTPIIDFALPDTSGKIHSPSDYADRKVLVMMFICNHCPYVQAIRDRLITLQASYDPHAVQLIGINANDASKYPDDSPEAMRKAIVEFGINFPYLIDETQEVAKNYQAQCTPDMYVFARGVGGTKSPGPLSSGESQREAKGANTFLLAYHGRLDDSWKDPSKVTKQELKEAIDALLRGENPSANQQSSMGCSIKWKT